MKQFSQLAIRIFQEAIQAYELRGSVDTPCTGNPYPEHTIEHDLFRKNWIDNSQWCLEDIAAGRKYMKVYKQMKMYNDPELNPMLKGQTL